MGLLEDALAAVGLLTVLYLPLSALLRPRALGLLPVSAVIPCGAGEGGKLERTVRALERLRCDRGCFRDIVILDRGMDGETRKIAALLCREAWNVTLTFPENTRKG